MARALHVANLPLGLGVPSDPDRLFRFEEWLDAASAAELTLAMQTLGRSRRGLQPDAQDAAAAGR